MLAAILVVAVIVAAIVLRVLSANPANSVVRDIHDAGRVLAGPFKTIFSFKHPKTAIAVNWGIAAAIYLIAGAIISGLLARLAPRPVATAPTAPAATTAPPAV
jgi:hypothetical protein